MTAPPCAAGCGRPSPSAALCGECTGGLRRDLRRLPGIDRDLEAILDPRRAAAGYGHGGGGGLPWHEPAGECRSQLRHDLEYWALQVTMARPRAMRPPVTVAAMAGWLHGQLAWIAGRAWSADMAAALAADRGRAMALLDPMPRADIPLPRDAACPQCGARGMMRAVVYTGDGDLRPSRITCHGCGHGWEPSQWLRLGRVILQQRKEAA